MRYFIAIIVLSVSVAFASQSQDTVKKHFADVIEAQMRLMLEAQFAAYPNHPALAQRQ